MTLKIIKTGKYIEVDIKRCLKEIGYIPKKKKVLIKPNIVSAYKPCSPCITNPRVVAGLIDYLHEMGIEEVVVGEGSVHPDFEKVVSVSGYSRMCKEKNVNLLNLYNAPMKKYKFFDGHILLPKILDEYEYINVAKLKTHTQTKVSLCIKNQKGLLSFADRRLFHKDLHRNIAELYKAVQPDFNMIDALNGLEGNGPGALGREVKNLNLVILGDDSWEVDSVAAAIMGIDLSAVEHLMLVNRDIARIQKYSEEIQKYKRGFKLPSDMYKFFNITYEWSGNTCSGCSSIMHTLKTEAFRNPRLFLKLAYYALFRGVYLITGTPKGKKSSGNIVCIGDCGKKFALENNLKFIAGCPPKTEDVLKAI